MEPSDRVVVSLPLTELWNDSGPLIARRGRWLAEADIRRFLRNGPVRFVIADVGHKLSWIDPAECFAFWKAEVRSRVCAGEAWSLGDYPGDCCYMASEWHLASGGVAVVLEKSH